MPDSRLHQLVCPCNIWCLQNGVLILVAIENRQIYISTGKGTMKYLTDKVLDQIIGQSRPFLREKK